jgi:tRNA pseudouridine32 synthase/23S rRNA pseudouridine746 synthase
MWQERVLFLDGEALVIDKPAGLPVHAGPSTKESLEDFLHQLRFGFHRSPTPVHRLDRDTSGCLLLARHPKAHKRFALAFEEQRVAKTYVAVLEGVPVAEAGRVDLPLSKISSRAEGWRMVGDAAGKPAATGWKLLAVKDARSLVQFEPETGRTHQIRVHAAEGIGIAVAGDPVYGDGRGFMLLHARSLRLERRDKAVIEATAPMPPTFLQAGFGDDDF